MKRFKTWALSVWYAFLNFIRTMTLIELMIIVAIVGILLSIVTGKSNHQGPSYQQRLKTEYDNCINTVTNHGQKTIIIDIMRECREQAQAFTK